MGTGSDQDKCYYTLIMILNKVIWVIMAIKVVIPIMSIKVNYSSCN